MSVMQRVVRDGEAVSRPVLLMDSGSSAGGDKREYVRQRLGDAAVAGKSDAWVDGAYKGLRGPGNDTERSVLPPHLKVVADGGLAAADAVLTDAEQGKIRVAGAYSELKQHLADGWKAPVR